MKEPPPPPADDTDPVCEGAAFVKVPQTEGVGATDSVRAPDCVAQSLQRALKEPSNPEAVGFALALLSSAGLPLAEGGGDTVGEPLACAREALPVRLSAAVGTDPRVAVAGAVGDGESLQATDGVRCGDADATPDGESGADKEGGGVTEGEPLARLEGLPVAELEGLLLVRGEGVAAFTVAVEEKVAPLVAVPPPAGVKDGDATGLRVWRSALPLAATEAEAMSVAAAQREGRGEAVPLSVPTPPVCVAARTRDELPDAEAQGERERAALGDAVACADVVGAAESEAEPLADGGGEGLPENVSLLRALLVRAADAEPGGGVGVALRLAVAEGVPAPV